MTSSLSDLIARHARLRPQSYAISDQDHAYTYAEVLDKGCRVAAALRMAGILPGDRVLMCTDRSAAALTAYLGVVVAGATLVPVELEVPALRFRHMVQATKPRAVLVDEPGALALTRMNLAEQAPQQLLIEELLRCPAKVDEPAAAPAVAYVMFTSGSTGVPKGVLVTSANLLALLDGAPQWDATSDEDVWGSFSSFTFDPSLLELWLPMRAGGQLFVLPRVAQLDADLLPALIEEAGITALTQTPTAGRLFASAVAKRHVPSTLQRWLLGGERLDMSMLEPFADHVAGGQLVPMNMYGPTETTVCATSYRISAHDIAHERRSIIGRPLPHVRVRLDRPDTDGIGEICVSGPGVTAGYLDDERLTSERYVRDAAGNLSYRTGDLAREVSDGTYEFIGRSGGFVKVRGYRVEPGEIAEAVRSHPDVADAFAFESDEPGYGASMVCAVVATEGTAPSERELRRYVASLLPAYMRPSRIVLYDSFPQLENSKLDVRSIKQRAANPPG